MVKKKIKTRKIRYRLGSLDWIDVPTDWRKASGIVAGRFETNMGLAKRDYSKKCDTGSEPLMVVEGFWLWWCYTHNQPFTWCEKEELALELNKISKALENAGFKKEVK